MKAALSICSIYISFATLTACAAQERHTSEAAAPALNVLATTDFHGELEGQENKLSDGTQLSIGGAPILASYIKILRTKLRGPVLWVDAGDLFQGTMASNLFEGSPVVRLMNHLGLQAAALGNHEFDYGPEGEKSVPREKGDDPRGALKARIKEAKFPILAANVKSTRGKVPEWLKPSAVVSTGGLRVGVVGGASPGTPGSTNALNLTGLKFFPLLPSLKLEAERLRREEKVDFVVITMHAGGGCENNSPSKQDDLSSCVGDDDAISLAKSLPAGLVNVIVAGHTHKGTAKRVNGTVILQPFSNGKYLGWAAIDAKGVAEVSGLAPVCEKVVDGTCDPFQLKNARGPAEPAKFFGEAIVPDQAVIALIAPEMEKVKELKETPLGISALDEFTRSYNGESALGNLVADISREALPGADLGLANGGGLRANISSGPVTYGDVFNVLPFDNQIAQMKVPGEKLMELVKVGVSGSVGAYTWSSNLSLIAENCELRDVRVNGAAVDPGKTYLVATSDFLAGGGSGVGKVGIPKENVEVFWDRKNLLRELTVDVLKRWRKDLRSVDYFDPALPRQKIVKKCERPQ